jgi:hypothetical protein
MGVRNAQEPQAGICSAVGGDPVNLQRPAVVKTEAGGFEGKIVDVRSPLHSSSLEKAKEKRTLTLTPVAVEKLAHQKMAEKTLR